ncbi:hypothetical protein A3Q56_07943, partial [Intoshia linei]
CFYIVEKRCIIEFNRPTPPLITTANARNFQMKWYEKIDWLCGSIVTMKAVPETFNQCYIISLQTRNAINQETIKN